MTYNFTHLLTKNGFFISALREGIDEIASVIVNKGSVKGSYTRPWGKTSRTIHFTTEGGLADLREHTEMSDNDFENLKSLIESGKRMVRGELLVRRNATSIDITYRHMDLVVTARLDVDVINGEMVSSVIGGYMITSGDTVAQWSGDHATLNEMASYHKKYNPYRVPSDVLCIGRTYPADKVHPEDIATVFGYAGLSRLEFDHLVTTINGQIDLITDGPIEISSHNLTTIEDDVVTIQCYRDDREITVEATYDTYEFDATWVRYTNSVWVSGTLDVDVLEGSTALEKFEFIYRKTFPFEIPEATLERLSAFIEEKDDQVSEQSPVVELPTLPWIYNKSGIEFSIGGFDVSTSEFDDEPYAIVVGPDNVREELLYAGDRDHDDDYDIPRGRGRRLDDDDYDIRHERRHRRRSSVSARQRKLYLATYDANGEVILTEL